MFAEWLPIIMFVSLALFIFSGLPVAVVLGGVSLVFAGIGLAMGEIGLDCPRAEVAHTLEEALDHQPTVLVMGSEGDGIRRLVAEHCDVLAKIPMPGGFESLNVSNAAAVALYEAARAQRG